MKSLQGADEVVNGNACLNSIVEGSIDNKGQHSQKAGFYTSIFQFPGILVATITVSCFYLLASFGISFFFFLNTDTCIVNLIDVKLYSAITQISHGKRIFF